MKAIILKPKPQNLNIASGLPKTLIKIGVMKYKIILNNLVDIKNQLSHYCCWV